MSKKPVHSLEDLKGKKYYAGGPAGVLVVKALGATPVTMSMADVYLSVDKGCWTALFLMSACLQAASSPNS